MLNKYIYVSYTLFVKGKTIFEHFATSLFTHEISEASGDVKFVMRKKFTMCDDDDLYSSPAKFL